MPWCKGNQTPQDVIIFGKLINGMLIMLENVHASSHIALIVSLKLHANASVSISHSLAVGLSRIALLKRPAWR